ncbi:hypothetical protein THASP1DRAFT_30554 [Thamnocephalis sphaerospora]|uniref:SCP domain-containing protein n=1 Tax=Thamnocephalis sphaerospora TaxID=78915 RepID=A0A4V1IWI0_9FUNG|nr:hypothetical protein THASP1DRAFT_30554 [Thamnocephalis sphaerospora]|eukprot:RKP07629.1 hypothetical protein THASP1DRAFT_30554 [Thamnocephalis sphaerospora]
MACLINKERQKAGKSPLGIDSSLVKSSQIHSQAQADAGTTSHQVSGEADFSERIKEQSGGKNWGGMSENVAGGQTDEADVMNSWMQSPGHRGNILGDFTHFGAGMAVGGGTKYWTQNFASDGQGGDFPLCPEDAGGSDQDTKETPGKKPNGSTGKRPSSGSKPAPSPDHGQAPDNAYTPAPSSGGKRPSGYRRPSSSQYPTSGGKPGGDDDYFDRDTLKVGHGDKITIYKKPSSGTKKSSKPSASTGEAPDSFEMPMMPSKPSSGSGGADSPSAKYAPSTPAPYGSAPFDTNMGVGSMPSSADHYQGGNGMMQPMSPFDQAGFSSPFGGAKSPGGDDGSALAGSAAPFGSDGFPSAGSSRPSDSDGSFGSPYASMGQTSPSMRSGGSLGGQMLSDFAGNGHAPSGDGMEYF